MGSRFEAAHQRIDDMGEELNRKHVGAIGVMRKGRSSSAFDGGVLPDERISSHQRFAQLDVETAL